MSFLYDALVYSKNPTNVIQYSTYYNSRNQEASVVKMNNGKLLLIWNHYGDASADLDPSEIWAKTSSNNGKTYSDGYVVIAIPVGTTGPRCASLYKKSNGDIILICMIGTDAGASTELWQYTSSDNGVTFTDGASIHSSTDYEAKDYYTVGSDRIFKTQSGRLLYPFDVCTSSAHSSGTSNTVGRVLYSDDEGANWSISATVMSAAASGVEALLAESCIWQDPDGTLFFGSRTRSGYARISTSSNDGTTWTNPPTKSGTLECSNASIYFGYINGKHIAIVSRPEGGVVNGAAARIHKDLWKSTDKCATWSFVKNIFDEDNVRIFAEPNIFDKGNSILVYIAAYPPAGSAQDLIFTEVLYSEF
jgi:hypothetical protein